MQAETLKTSTHNQLKTKSGENTTYRKALTIYESILDSTRDIPNFEANYANTDSNFALFVFGSVFKLLLKNQQQLKYNMDGMLMLINMNINHLNITVIKNNGIMQALQNKIFSILKDYHSEQKTPLMIRLAISILSYTLVNTQNIDNNQQSIQILQQLLNFSIQSHRTNILSKQSAKMLTHLVKANPSISRILSRYATMHMLANIDSNLYLNNIREVILQFPLQLVNDIGYRVSKHMSNIECTSQNDEVYLAQTYYLLEKLANKFSLSTLQQICKQLINNVPTTNSNQSKIMHCYIQALHTMFESLISMNEKTGNKYLCTVVSILEEFITKGGRVEKQAVGVLRAIMGTCIRKSLWVNSNKMEGEDDQFDELNLEDMGLDQPRKGSHFSRVLCMLEGLLSDQYPNYKSTASILTAFFDSLDKTALSSVLNLVEKIINFRQKFDDKSYKKLIQAIFGALTINNICQIYRIGVDGDISDENYESNNNLWLVYCTEKYQGQQQFATYMTYYYPLLIQLKNIIKTTPNLSPIRIEAYKSLIEMLWRCLKVFCRKPNQNDSYELIIELIKSEIGQANDSTLDHISMALENLCSNLYKQEYQCKWAGNLISLLAKNLNIEKNNSKQILRAIKYLSAIADKEYMTKVFDKNIVKLIQQKQKGVLHATDNIQNNMKNLEILIAVSKGIDFFNNAVVAPYRISREELVVKLIESLLQENSLFQKKAYKYIHQTLPLMGDSYLNEVVELLEAHQHKIMTASKHYRLAILMYLWTKLSSDENKLNQSFEFMKKYLPEVLLNMREANQRTRKQATVLYESFCKKILQMELMENFVEIMCAGLAVDSVETKISTLQGLVEIYVKKYQLPLEFSVGILEIVLMLLYEQRSQIYKAVVEFCRRFIFSFEKTKQINHILSTVLQQLFKADLASKLENRSILKHFLLKLTKRFGRETVEKLIPAQDRKILGNAIKTENRQKRKKKQRQIQRRLQIEEARKNKLSESQSQQNQNQQIGAENNENEMVEQENEQLKELRDTDNLLLKYDLEQENFHFEQDKYHIKSREKKEKNQQNKQADPISFENGLMIVKDDPRRKRDQKLDEQSEKQQQTEAKNYLNVKKKRKLNDVHEVKESGATFKSNRAGGDLQLKDKPSPYAFIQFNSKALNKRFKKRAEKVFDTVFERSEGGLKGIKSKIANRRH